jgi:tetratricopeptide (TPR) repeat protein
VAIAWLRYRELWIERMRQSLKTILLMLAGLAVVSAASAADEPKSLIPAPPPAPPPVVMAPAPSVTGPASAPMEAPAAAAAPAPAGSAPASGATPAATDANAAPTLAPIAPSCLPEIAKAEKRYRIPDGLLVSIALAESGRRDPDTGILAPWPWTIDAHGQGQFFDSVDEAAAAAGAMLARGDALVDVGCMQVDLYHHPHAFQTLLAAFDPETNVDYAAKYLVELKSQAGSWAGAVGAYNTGNPRTGGEYVARVLYYWKDVGTTEASARVVAEKPNLRGFAVDTSPAPLEIAANFVEKKDYPAAIAIYRAVLAGTPDDQTALLGLAQSMRAGGHNDEAREQLEHLLAGNPGNRAGLALLLSIIDEMPAPQRLTALLSARQVVPTSAQIPARLAMLEQGRGNTKEALAQMGTAVRLEPGDPIVMLDYALLLDRAGYRAASIEAYGRFLEIYRPNSVALTVPLDQIRQRLSYLRTLAR